MHDATPLRAAIYVRLSDYRGEDDPTLSPESQEALCRERAAQLGAEVVIVETDLDETATSKGRRLERPGLARLLRRMDEFDVLIARDIERLSRSVLDFAALRERCKAKGVGIATVKERLYLVDDGGTGTFISNILAAFAEMEAAQIGWRQAQSRAALAKAGRYGGGKIPYGMRRADAPEGNGSILEPDPAEVEVIQRALDLALEDGLSWHQVAQKLTEEGFKPREGGVWRSGGILRTLRNPVLRGYAIHKGKLVTDDKGVPIRFWEPVILPEDWERLEPLVALRPIKSRRLPRTTILSGLAVCAKCGGPLYRAIQMPKNGAHYDVMRCPGASTGRACSGVTVKRDFLETYVMDQVKATFGVLPEFHKEVRRKADGRLDAIRQAIAETTDAMRVPGADIAALADRLVYLHKRREEVEAQGDEEVEVVEPTGLTVAEALDSEDVPLARKQAVLAEFLTRVEVSPGQRGRRKYDDSRFTLHWKTDDPDFAYRDIMWDITLVQAQ